VFHIERLVHAAGDFDTQILVGRVFGNFHFVPLGELEKKNEKRKASIKNRSDEERENNLKYLGS
jgi:hypothetical protein